MEITEEPSGLAPWRLLRSLGSWIPVLSWVEQENTRATEQESERARRQEGKRVRGQESKRARERE